MKKTYTIILLIIVLCLLCFNVFSQELCQTSTEHFTFIYEKSAADSVAELLHFAEDVYGKVTSYFDMYPDDIMVVVSDDLDTANGYFSGARPHINLLATGPKTSSFGFGNENWLKYVLTHELTHYVHLTWEDGPVYDIARVFGPTALMLRNIGMPGWALEGITTNLETDLTGGGRGRNPFFELYYKAPIIENSMFTLEEAGFGSPYPPSGRIYVAGYIIVNYMMRTFGHDIFARIVRRQHNDPVSFDEAVELETGESLENIFADMKIELTKSYVDDLVIEGGKIISPRKNGNNYSFPVIAGNSYYSYRQNADSVPAIVKFTREPDSEKGISEEEVILETSLPTTDSFCVSADGAAVYFISSEYTYGFTGIVGIDNDLCRLDTQTGRITGLTGGVRLYDLALSPDGSFIAAAQAYDSYSRLVKIDLESLEISTLWEPEQGAVYTPVFSPGGDRIVFSASLRGMQDLYVFNQQTGEVSPLFGNDSAGDFNPLFSEDGEIFFCRESKDSLRLFRLGEDGELECIAEDPVGILEGRIIDGSLVYASYSSQGFCIKALPAPKSAVYRETVRNEELTPAFDFSKEAKKTESADESFLNLPLPVLWFPSIGISSRPGDLSYGFGASAAGLPVSRGFNEYDSLWSATALWYPEDSRPEGYIFSAFKTGPALFTGLFNHEFSGTYTAESTELYSEKTTAACAVFLPLANKGSVGAMTEFMLNAAFIYSLERTSASTFGLLDSGENITAKSGMTAAAGLSFLYLKNAAPVSGVSPFRVYASAEFFMGPASLIEESAVPDTQAVIDTSVRFPLFNDKFLIEAGISAAYTSSPCPYNIPRGPEGFMTEPGDDEGSIIAGIDYLVGIAGGFFMFLSMEAVADFSIIEPGFTVRNTIYPGIGYGIDIGTLQLRYGISFPYQLSETFTGPDTLGFYISFEFFAEKILGTPQFSITGNQN